MIRKEIPQEPYSAARVISAKVDPELHRRVREYAARHDCLPSHVIKAALLGLLSMEANPRPVA